MPELIDADALLESMKESAIGCREWKEEAQDEEVKIRADQARGTFIECALRVKNAPTIEPEVRRGRWILKILDICGGDKIRMYQCSDCGKYANMKFDFCPNCGCDMCATDTNVGGKGGADNG